MMATLSQPWAPERTTARSSDISDASRGAQLQLDRAPLPEIDRPHAATAILDVTKWFGETSGGVKTYLLEKARWAEAHPSVRHTLVIPGPCDAVTVADGTRAYRLRGPRIPGESAYRFLLAPRTLRRIVEHERPDVIEIGSPVFVPWVTALAARRLGVPLVHFHHTSVVAVWRALFPGMVPGKVTRSVLGIWARRLDRLVHRTIVASAFAARELETAGVTRISRVPLGVDLDRFHPGRRAWRDRTLRRLGLPLDRPLGLFVGRFAPEKRLDVLLQAWVNVERASGAHLVLVGHGSAEGALRGGCTASQVTWLPYLHDRETLAQLIAAADVFVSPGDVETFGLAALEALASGVPVVASAAGAVAELVERSGAGCLFASGSPGSCAHAVRDTLAGDAATYRLMARSFAEREHDWDTVFERLHAVYREVIHDAAGLDS